MRVPPQKLSWSIPRVRYTIALRKCPAGPPPTMRVIGAARCARSRWGWNSQQGAWGLSMQQESVRKRFELSYHLVNWSETKYINLLFLKNGVKLLKLNFEERMFSPKSPVQNVGEIKHNEGNAERGKHEVQAMQCTAGLKTTSCKIIKQ